MPIYYRKKIPKELGIFIFKLIIMKIFLCLILTILPIFTGVSEFYTLIPIPVPYKTVTVTTYTVNSVDSLPILTASGFELDTVNPKRHRIIAISRDLQRFFKFGDTVSITNAGKYNGFYIVRDLMHNKWSNKIDILINPDDVHTKLFKVKLFKFIK